MNVSIIFPDLAKTFPLPHVINVMYICRSVNQLHIMLRLLQDEFPNMIIVEKVDNCIEAAMALIRELEMTRDKKNALEIQEAKLVTDLLIP